MASARETKSKGLFAPQPRKPPPRLRSTVTARNPRTPRRSVARSLRRNPINEMKASTRNKTAGSAKIAKGKTKAIAGKATGKRLLQAKGRVQEAAGKVQKKIGSRQKAEGK